MMRLSCSECKSSLVFLFPKKYSHINTTEKRERLDVPVESCKKKKQLVSTTIMGLGIIRTFVEKVDFYLAS